MYKAFRPMTALYLTYANFLLLRSFLLYILREQHLGESPCDLDSPCESLSNAKTTLDCKLFRREASFLFSEMLWTICPDQMFKP